MDVIESTVTSVRDSNFHFWTQSPMRFDILPKNTWVMCSKWHRPIGAWNKAASLAWAPNMCGPRALHVNNSLGLGNVSCWAARMAMTLMMTSGVIRALKLLAALCCCMTYHLPQYIYGLHGGRVGLQSGQKNLKRSKIINWRRSSHNMSQCLENSLS